jgi:hypothetical protein
MNVALILTLTLAAAPQPTGAPANPGAADQGPSSHLIYTAASRDGLAWTADTRPLLRQASVPSALLHPDGRVLLYYVDASIRPSGVALAVSRDGGRTFARSPLVLDAPAGLVPVDPCPVLLPDGRVRLYYYLFEHRPGEHDPIHRVAAAISDNGETFAYEGIAFAYRGLVDPDVFWDGTRWRMHVMSLSDNGTVVATSDDGLAFRYNGLLSLRQIGTTKPVTLSDSPALDLRLYGFPQGPGGQREFRSFRSEDGIEWERESGVRLTPPPGMGQITDPFVIRLGDGTWKMFYKAEPSRGTTPGGGPSPRPSGPPRPPPSR